MSFLDLFKPKRTPPPPSKSRLAIALEETERLKDLLKQADIELFAAAAEAFPQGRLVWAEYKGYGIIIGTQVDILYKIDVHTMTYSELPRLSPNQIHNVKIGDIRVVPWSEAVANSNFFAWILAHPLSEVIHKVNQ
jgi:hypothetical protein